MSKRRKQKQQNNRTLLIGVVVAALLLAVAGIALLGGGPETAQAGEAVALLSPDQYEQQFLDANQGHLLLDVRTAEEFNSGHIPGAVNIPVESLANRLSEVPGDQPVVVYCRSGNRSATAADILSEAGYSSIYDMGGIITWVEQGRPIQ